MRFIILQRTDKKYAVKEIRKKERKQAKMKRMTTENYL